MSSYLVTGAEGQLGKCFNKVANEFPIHKLIFASKNKVDITRPKTLKIFFDDHPLDGIINCAAYTQVDQAEESPQKAYQINVDGIKNLIAFAEEKTLSIVNFSTDYIFDGTSKSNYLEDHIPNPLNVYGKTKYKAEILLKNAKCINTTFRISWMFSPFGSNFVKTVLNNINKKRKLSVVDDHKGRLTYGIDLARVVLSNIDQNHFFDYDCYNYALMGETTWFDLAKEIKLIKNSNCEIIPCSSKQYFTRALRPKNSILDTSRIENHLSLKILDWTNALDDCLKRIEGKNII